MTGPSSHALWRAAPLRLARTPTWLVLVLVAASLLLAAAVAPTLFAASARGSAWEAGVRNAQAVPYGPESADLRVTWDATLDAAGDAEVRRRLDAVPAYPEPVLTATGVGQNGVAKSVAQVGRERTPAVLWYRDGALAAIGADDDASSGVWLPTATAAALGLKVGDEFRIGLHSIYGNGAAKPRTVLAGTYETEPDSTLPAALADDPDAHRMFLPAAPELPGVGTPLAITDRATFDRLIKRSRDTPLYVMDMPLPDGVSPDEAERAARVVARLSAEAFDPSTDLGAALARTEPSPGRLEVASGLAVISEAADSTAVSARDQVRPYAAAGLVLTVAVLVSAWGLLAHSRRREQILVSGLGLRPGTLALLAVLEVLPVALLAVPAGLGLALLGLRTAGPGDGYLPPVTGGDLARASIGLVAVLLLVAFTATVVAVGADRLAVLSRLGRVRRPLPWALALLAVTAVVAGTVYTADVGRRTGMGLTVALPLLVVASVAVVVTRVLAWLRPRLPLRSRPGSPRWLAGRRTGTVVRDVTALSAVVAIAFGVFGYTLTVRRGIDQGIEDKTAAIAGARTSIGVIDGLRGEGMRRAVEAPAPGTTVVWSRGVSLPPAYGEDRLMAIDPTSFADVADWGASGEVERLRSVVPRLAKRATGLAVLVVGDTKVRVGDQGTLDFSSEVQVPFEVVGTAAAFPGASLDGARTAVVVSARRLFRLLPPTIDPRGMGAVSTAPGALASTVWYDGPPRRLRELLEDAHVRPDGAIDTADAERVEAGLVASSWAAAYALALGVVVLALALAAALVLALRLAERDRTSDVLLRRMGYTRPELARSRVWEAAYAVGSAVAVAVLATALLMAAPSTVDATSLVPPLTRPRAGGAELVVAVAVVAGTLVLVWLLSSWRATRTDAAEVLRSGD